MQTRSEPADLTHAAAASMGRSESEASLCRATLYAALALGFRPPTTETLQRLTAPAAAAALADAAAGLDVGLRTLAAALTQPAATLDTLSTEHRRLFGHTVRAAVPAYETEYGDEALFQQPQEMSDLGGFMRAFGLALRPDVHERVDHVSCECEFLSFLACKEAYAIESADEEMGSATVRATGLFLRAHLGRFVPAFTYRLAQEAPGTLYERLAGLLGALVEFDCRRLGVPHGKITLGLRPDPASVAAPMGCDAADNGSCPGGAT